MTTLVQSIYIVCNVFGRGMKGRDPYAKNVTLPDGVDDALLGMPEQREALISLVTGSQVALLDSELKSPIEELDAIDEERLQPRFLQLSRELTSLRWSYTRYILIDQIVDVGRLRLRLP